MEIEDDDIFLKIAELVVSYERLAISELVIFTPAMSNDIFSYVAVASIPVHVKGELKYSSPESITAQMEHVNSHLKASLQKLISQTVPKVFRWPQFVNRVMKFILDKKRFVTSVVDPARWEDQKL